MTGGATIAVGVHYSAAESRPHGTIPRSSCTASVTSHMICRIYPGNLSRRHTPARRSV